ncbi:MAG: precorrin-6y C5,15-methyltransferase (decarboxylating) subunit CbiE [Gemmatimonas sp.]
MSEPWLSVVGIGADGLRSIAPAGRDAIDRAEILVGGARHLALIPPDGRERMAWDSPIATTIDRLGTLAGRRVVVLASGDPMSFGIGATLARRFGDAVRIISAPGAIALACARRLWPEESVTHVSLCGRPVETVALHLEPGARLVVLSADGATPNAVAAFLTARGYGPSAMTVFERLGADDERAVSGDAASWQYARLDDLNTITVECRATPDALVLSRVPGLPDDAFAHDGQITKRELRALALAALAPRAGEMLWDIGAGCGSVSVEWLRAAPRTQAIAIERNPERAAFCTHNAANLGVPGLRVITAEAPAALAGLPSPDAVFVGGGVTVPGVLEAAWSALRERGRIVAHAVTVDGEARLIEAATQFRGTLTRVGVERAEPLGNRTGFRPARAVTQLVAERRR